MAKEEMETEVNSTSLPHGLISYREKLMGDRVEINRIGNRRGESRQNRKPKFNYDFYYIR